MRRTVIIAKWGMGAKGDVAVPPNVRRHSGQIWVFSLRWFVLGGHSIDVS